MSIKLKKSIDRCPKCGCKEFSVKSRISGFAYTHHYMDGSGQADNTSMWDYVKDTPYKTAHCSNCNMPLGGIFISEEDQ